MNSKTLPENYLSAEGPDGLLSLLTDLLRESQANGSVHTILYQIGKQRSLIKVDFSQKPVQFWYDDLAGRPATKAVKETIARFLWEKCGERERYLNDLSIRE